MTKEIRCSKCGKKREIWQLEYSLLRTYIQSALNMASFGKLNRVESSLNYAIEELNRLKSPCYQNLNLLFAKTVVFLGWCEWCEHVKHHDYPFNCQSCEWMPSEGDEGQPSCFQGNPEPEFDGVDWPW